MRAFASFMLTATMQRSCMVWKVLMSRAPATDVVQAVTARNGRQAWSYERELGSSKVSATLLASFQESATENPGTLGGALYYPNIPNT